MCVCVCKQVLSLIVDTECGDMDEYHGSGRLELFR